MERLFDHLPATPAQDSQIASRGSWDRLVTGVVAASVILGALLLAIMCFGLWQSYQEVVEDAQMDTMNLAHVIAENARQGIRQIDLNLSTTEEVILHWPTGKTIPDKQLDWLLNGRRKLMPDVGMLFITDRNGIRTHAASAQPVPPNAALADRDYFTWHRDHASPDVRVGPPVLSRVFNTWYIPVSRRLVASDGQFDGVMVAALEPKFLQSFYSSIDTGPGGLVTIFLRDGTLLARAPHNDSMVGKQYSQAPLFRDDLPRAARGNFRRVTSSDGVARIGSYSTVPVTGLVVQVAFAENSVFAGWRRQMAISIAEISTFIVALAVMTFLLINQLRRQQAITTNLARSESRYRRLRDTANEGIWHVDAERRTIFVNPRLCEMLGYVEEELTGRSPGDFIHEDDQVRSLDKIEQRKTTRSPVQYDLRFRRKDGAVLWTIVSAVSTFDEHDAFTGVLAMLTDITARAESEAAVHRHVIRLEGLHALDKAILAAQSSESIAAIGLLHLRKLVPYWGATVMAFDHGADEARVLNLTRDADSTYDPGPRLSLSDYGRGDIALLQTGDECVVIDLDAVPKRSPVLEALWQKGMRSYVRVPLLAEGRLVGVINLGSNHTGAYSAEQIAIARSIADQMAIALRQAALREEVQSHAANLERRVAERTAELDAANRELDSFASSVSHDLRAPLRHISGFLNLLAKDNPGLDATSQHYILTITRSAEHMETLIDDLLSLARTSTCELHKAPVNMNALVASVREELAPQCAGRSIEWKVADLPDALGDLSLMRIVMQNLLGNSLKYSSRREHAVIEIASRINENKQVEFVVRDNGAGFDMRYAGKLFRAFSRLHSAREFEGTGVGLATVQRIVNRHGGKIRANSQLGEWAEFSFTLGSGI